MYKSYYLNLKPTRKLLQTKNYVKILELDSTYFIINTLSLRSPKHNILYI